MLLSFCSAVPQIMKRGVLHPKSKGSFPLITWCRLQRGGINTFLLFWSQVSCAHLVRQKVFPVHDVSLWKSFSCALPLSWGCMCLGKQVWEEGLRNGRLQGAVTYKKSWVIWNGQGSPAHLLQGAELLSFLLPWEAMAFSAFCVQR